VRNTQVLPCPRFCHRRVFLDRCQHTRAVCSLTVVDKRCAPSRAGDDGNARRADAGRRDVVGEQDARQGMAWGRGDAPLHRDAQAPLRPQGALPPGGGGRAARGELSCAGSRLRPKWEGVLRAARERSRAVFAGRRRDEVRGGDGGALPPPSRTNWTRLVPSSVLTGHVLAVSPLAPPPSSLLPQAMAVSPLAPPPSSLLPQLRPRPQRASHRPRRFPPSSLPPPPSTSSLGAAPLAPADHARSPGLHGHPGAARRALARSAHGAAQSGPASLSLSHTHTHTLSLSLSLI